MKFKNLPGCFSSPVRPNPTGAGRQATSPQAPRIKVQASSIKEQASGLIVGVGPAHKLYPACDNMSRDNMNFEKFIRRMVAGAAVHGRRHKHNYKVKIIL